MVEAVKRGFPQREIADAAFELQTEIDSGRRTVVGVNRFTEGDEQATEILRIDPALERKQIERVQAVRADRDEAAVAATLAAIKDAAGGQANLMPLLLDAARAHFSEGLGPTGFPNAPARSGDYRSQSRLLVGPQQGSRWAGCQSRCRSPPRLCSGRARAQTRRGESRRRRYLAGAHRHPRVKPARRSTGPPPRPGRASGRSGPTAGRPGAQIDRPALQQRVGVGITTDSSQPSGAPAVPSGHPTVSPRPVAHRWATRRGGGTPAADLDLGVAPLPLAEPDVQDGRPPSCHRSSSGRARARALGATATSLGVTRWSKFGRTWRGAVDARGLIEPCPAQAGRRTHLLAAIVYGGYTTKCRSATPPSTLRWSPTSPRGRRSSPTTAGPARLLVPHLYFCRSRPSGCSAWSVLDHDQLGFLERNGYHHRRRPVARGAPQRHVGDYRSWLVRTMRRPPSARAGGPGLPVAAVMNTYKFTCTRPACDARR